MKLTTQVFLDLLGVGELLENIKAVAEDRLGLHRRRSHAQLAGRTAIVTGGNAGVGYATAEALVRQGAHVVLACRSTQRGQAAAERLAAIAAQLAPPAAGQARGSSASGPRPPALGSPACAPRVEVQPLDLASLASVRRFVRRWQASGRGLDLLVCNAGVMCPPHRTLTQDGFELQFQARRGILCVEGVFVEVGLPF
jgi:WW domain-containing oxidoreductase